MSRANCNLRQIEKVYKVFAVTSKKDSVCIQIFYSGVRLEKILVDGKSIQSISKSSGISRNTIRKILKTESPPGYGGRKTQKEKKYSSIKTVKLSKTELDQIRWQEWIYEIERGNLLVHKWEEALSGQNIHNRKIVLAVMAKKEGFTTQAISRHLGISRNTILFRLNAYIAGGIDGLLGRKSKPRLVDDVAFTKALFTLLHEPPSLSGFNRTSWRLDDLRQALSTQGIKVCKDIISKAIHKAGFRWRSAKVVLTSNDPKYREKLERIQSILSNLGERFFSIDEYGPFAIKTKAVSKVLQKLNTHFLRAHVLENKQEKTYVVIE